MASRVVPLIVEREAIMTPENQVRQEHRHDEDDAPKSRDSKGSASCATSAASPRLRAARMKNFSDAAFEPAMIEAMIASHVNLLAESILRTAQAASGDVATLQVTPRT
jgi:hypothetical protein